MLCKVTAFIFEEWAVFSKKSKKADNFHKILKITKNSLIIFDSFFVSLLWKSSIQIERGINYEKEINTIYSDTCHMGNLLGIPSLILVFHLSYGQHRKHRGQDCSLCIFSS